MVNNGISEVEIHSGLGLLKKALMRYNIW